MQGKATGVANTTLKVFAGKGLHQPVISFRMVNGMMHQKCRGMTARAKNQLAVFSTINGVGLQPELQMGKCPGKRAYQGEGSEPVGLELERALIERLPGAKRRLHDHTTVPCC